MIRDIKLETFHGATSEAPKTYQISFFFKFRKTPATLYLKSDMGIKEFYMELIDFIKVVMVLEDS